MSSMGPRDHVDKLHLALIWVRLASKCSRSPKRKSIWPDRDLRRSSPRTDGRLLRQRSLGLLILKISSILQPKLIAQPWLRLPHPPPQRRIQLRIAAAKARPSNIDHWSRPRARRSTRTTA